MLMYPTQAELCIHNCKSKQFQAVLGIIQCSHFKSNSKGACQRFLTNTVELILNLNINMMN